MQHAFALVYMSFTCLVHSVQMLMYTGDMCFQRQISNQTWCRHLKRPRRSHFAFRTTNRHFRSVMLTSSFRFSSYSDQSSLRSTSSKTVPLAAVTTNPSCSPEVGVRLQVKQFAESLHIVSMIAHFMSQVVLHTRQQQTQRFTFCTCVPTTLTRYDTALQRKCSANT